MFRLNRESIRMQWTLWVVMGFVLIASLSIVIGYGDHFLLGTFEKLNNDDVKYVHSAQVLLEKHTLSYNSGENPSAFIMPGVPFMLAGLMTIFGHHEGGVIAFRVFQSILQTASIYLLFVIARHAFNSRIAIISCILSACYVPDYFASGEILSEAAFKFIFMLMVIFTILAVQKRSMRYYFILTCLWVMACYFKPQTSLYPIVILILWWIHKYSWKDMVKYSVTAAILFCMLLSPWWVRNIVSFGHLIVFTNSAGNPLLQGALVHNEMPSEGFFAKYPEYKNDLFIGNDKDAVTTGKRIVIYGITHEPLKYIYWYTIGKAIELYKWPFYWRTILGLNDKTALVMQIGIVLAGFVGMLGTLSLRMRKNTAISSLLLAFGFFTLIYLPFVTFSRYGYPNMFIILIFAAVTLDRIVNRVQAFAKSAPANQEKVPF